MRPVIVVVDDDLDTLNLLTSFFTNCHYKVRSALNAMDAFALIDQYVELIITDQDMPGLSGSCFRDMVRQKYDIPIIGITGLHTIDKDRFCKKFDDALFKPFRLAALERAVRRFLPGASRMQKAATGE